MPVATLARFIVLEARRSGLPWLAAAALVVALALAAFLSAVAVTEAAALRTAIVAAVLRASAVFLVAAHVSASTLREINDKGLELMLALPLPRPAQYLGRLAGYCASAALLALAFAAPLLLWSSPPAVLLWAVSLACECALVAALSLFFSMTLAQLVPAIASTLGLYLLARAMATIQAIASGPLFERSFASELQRVAVDGLALLLPRLDAATRTEWLLYDAPTAASYAATLGGLLVYAALVTAAGLFDFQRKSV